MSASFSRMASRQSSHLKSLTFAPVVFDDQTLFAKNSPNCINRAACLSTGSAPASNLIIGALPYSGFATTWIPPNP